MEMEIVTDSGKVYKNLRAYHIALGHAVRRALIDLYKEVKEFAIQKTKEFYDNEFGGSDYYDNTYGMINALESSDDLNGAISYYIKGSYNKNYTFEIEIDWDTLDSHINEGKFGTYTSFDGTPVVDIWDELLEKGLPIYPNDKRHPSFDLGKLIQDFIDKRIDDKVQKAIEEF